MAKGIARYTVTNGLEGCYMPDSVSSPVEFRTRRDLVNDIRDEIELLGWPKSAIKQVKINRLWAHIKRWGSSSAHFSITRDGYELAYHGLTDAEYHAATKDDA